MWGSEKGEIMKKRRKYAGRNNIGTSKTGNSPCQYLVVGENVIILMPVDKIELFTLSMMMLKNNQRCQFMMIMKMRKKTLMCHNSRQFCRCEEGFASTHVRRRGVEMPQHFQHPCLLPW